MLERRACVRSSGRVQESILAGRLCRLGGGGHEPREGAPGTEKAG